MTDPQKAAIEALEWCQTLIKLTVKPDRCVSRDEEMKSSVQIFELAENALTHLRASSPVEVTVDALMVSLGLSHNEGDHHVLKELAKNYPAGLKIITPPQAKE